MLAWLWVELLAGVPALPGELVVMLRGHGMWPRRLHWPETAALLGGIGAILLMQAVACSGFRDLGGPINRMLSVAIPAAGAIGTLIATYAAPGMPWRLA
jgi:hypothetical protein